LNSSDFVVPRIKLLQGISPELETYESAKAGDFWVNVVDIPLGDTFDFIPILNRKRYMLTTPLKTDGGRILARADDGVHWKPESGSWQVKVEGQRNPVTWEIKDSTVRGSGLAEFGSSNPEDPESNPASTLFYDFLVMVRNNPEFEGSPVMLSLARSAAKKGKDLNGKIGFGAAPMQSRVFRASVFKDNSASGAFNNWTFTSNGYAHESEYLVAKKLADRFSAINFRGVGDEDTGEGGGTGGGEDTKEF
jgi:hypothetical protein